MAGASARIIKTFLVVSRFGTCCRFILYKTKLPIEVKRWFLITLEFNVHEFDTNKASSGSLEDGK